MCIVEIHISANNITIFSAAQKSFYGNFMSLAAKKKKKKNPYLGLPVKCPIFLSEFNQIWSLSQDCHESPQYQISEKTR
jgi:hypothetical protein